MISRDRWEGPLIIDTMIATWLMRRKENVEPFRPIISGHVLVLPFMVTAELKAGAENAGWGEQKRSRLDRFISQCVALPSNEAMVDWWSRIHGAMARQVGDADEWIAAAALAHNLPIVTDNLKHFQRIQVRFPGLCIFHPSLP